MTMSKKAAAVIDEFGRSRGVTHEHVEYLRDLFEASPLLADKLDEITRTGRIRFVLKNDPQEKDGYSSRYRELHLDSRMLSKADDRSDQFKRIGFLGYEMQRALHHKEQARALDRISEKARKISASGSRERGHGQPGVFDRVKARAEKAVTFSGAERNYTDLVRKYVDTRRSYQAIAEITRWNTVVSALHKESGNPAVLPAVPGPKHSRWYKSFEVEEALPADFRYADHVVHDDQLYVAASEQNIKAVARNVEAGEHAVNSAFTNRGHLGNAHGPHVHAADLINHIAACEQRRGGPDLGVFPPYVRIDAAALGLDPDALVEHAGNSVDGGDCLAHMRYIDRSDGAARILEFDPAERLAGKDPLKLDQDGHSGDAQSSRATEGFPDRLRGESPLKLNQEGHPDHELYCRTLKKVCALECTLSGESRDNMAAALMVKAIESGIRIDVIAAVGTRVYAVQDPQKMTRAYVEMDLARAATTPFDTSCTQWDEKVRERRQVVPTEPRAEGAFPQGPASVADRGPWDQVIQEMKQVNSRRF